MMSRAVLLNAVVLTVIASACTSQHSAGTIIGYPIMRIADTNPSGITMSKAATEAKVLSFKLPNNAAQGKPEWYVIQAHVILQATPPFPQNAKLQLTAATDNAAALQMTFESADENLLAWNGVSAVDGALTGYTSSGVVNALYTNYLQVSGVRPGTNTLTVGVSGEAAPSWGITIAPDTAILRTEAPPPKLHLSVDVPSTAIAVGDTFSVGYELDPGAWPARGVAIGVRTSDPSLKALSSATTLGTLRIPVSGSFRFQATKAGTYQIELAAQSTNAHSPYATLETQVSTVAPQSSGSKPSGLEVALSVGVLGVFILAIPPLYRIARRRRTS